MKQHIAFFIPSLRGGGAERVMMTLAQNFSAQGVHVDMVLANAEGPYLSELPRKVRVINLSKPRVLYALFGLASYLRKEKPVVLLSTLNHANVVAIIAKIISGASTRVVVRQANTLSTNPGKAHSFSGMVMPFFIRRFYPFADVVVAVSHGVARDLVVTTGLSKQKIVVIYNPVVSPDIFTKADEEPEHPWFRPGGPPIILSVGRLNILKDFKTLIRSIILTREICPLRLLILGEGECRSELERIIAENNIADIVSLPGFVQNPFPYMKNADVFVLSSISEGLPNALIQSLALGTPVVSTNCPNGPEEILESGHWGALVPVKNPELMSSAIISVLKKGHKKNSEVKAYCRDRFGEQKISLEYLKILIR